jgi:excisionase family DNA binding protein
MTPDPSLLTIDEVADETHLRPRTVYDRINKGLIAAIKTPAGFRIPRDAIAGVGRFRAPKTRPSSVQIRRHGARGNSQLGAKHPMRRSNWEESFLRRAARENTIHLLGTNDARSTV